MIEVIVSDIWIRLNLAKDFTKSKLGWYKFEFLNGDNTIQRFYWDKTYLQRLSEQNLLQIYNKLNNFETKEIDKPIDKVTTSRLDMALRMCRYELDHMLIDNIIDLVELIEDKGDDVTICDITYLQAEWKKFDTF